MELKQFIDLYSNHPSLIEAFAQLKAPGINRFHFKSLAGSSSVLVFSALFKTTNSNVLLTLNDFEEAAYFYDDLVTLGFENEALFFPTSYKRSIQYGAIETENIVRRTEVLNRLKSNKKSIIITYPEALVEKVITYDALSTNTLSISKGEKVSIEFINDVLHEYDFEQVEFVHEPGQYSVRGSIIDIFSYSNEEPYRIDFFGNEVESLRSFAIETQLSNQFFETISIIPNIQEGLKDVERVSFFNYLNTKSICIFRDIQFTLDKIDEIFHESIGKPFENGGEITESLLSKSVDLIDQIKAYTAIEFGVRHYFEECELVNPKIQPQPTYNKNFELLAADFKQNRKNGYKNFILSNSEKQIERLKAIFNDSNFNIDFIPVNFTLHEGFIDRDLKCCFYTDHQIFERYHRYKQGENKSSKASLTIKELNKLHQGDYVVHIDHGIGRFAGLVKTEVDGKFQEAIRLVYKDNDSLLVSIHSLHRISKYRGKEGTEPVMNKLGTAAWQKMKSRTKSKVKDIAKDLIALYSLRLQEQGFAFSADSYLQQELEASFIYEDTPDQVKATQAVKEDMEKLMPMDRLVCGDVGFGKTEVAIRAAFKAATDSKQVAVLVPTTILALQHYKTFTERLKEFPVKIGYVSRLRSSAEIKKTLEEVENGKIDIIIGTHRLVGKDIKFKDLGLLIVDEEQKFGVSVKEKLKQLKANVDTLTLTATPIPRTLQFSLMGARDLSIIQTPPPNRYPIQTEVHGFNEAIIREAINFEIARNGQIFFIHNRVQSIYEVEDFIKRTCPGIRTIVGHGQLDGEKLEKVMTDFINGDFDILISTTIIESGLDIPNANTIIINQAQNFGLSELHQLRGRVGRTNKKAFCYLLTPPLSTLTTEARRRLKAIEEFSELGSGFNISMQDLDIRGAGNLLGGEQSGFIADIGYETYHRILNEAILELRQEEFKYVFENQDIDTSTTDAFLDLKFVNDCVIEADLEMRFPENYIQSTTERMSLYRDLDNIETVEKLDKFEKQLIDRFGKLPDQARGLFDVVKLRWNAIDLGVEKIILKNKKMIWNFVSDQQSHFYKSKTFTDLLQWMQKNQAKCRMKEDKNKLTMVFDKVDTVKKALETIEQIKLQ